MHIILLIIKKSKNKTFLKFLIIKMDLKSESPKGIEKHKKRNRKLENIRKLSEIPGSFPGS
jgi:hypothetical protein